MVVVLAVALLSRPSSSLIERAAALFVLESAAVAVAPIVLSVAVIVAVVVMALVLLRGELLLL
jgi:hypothetical protein